MYFRTNSLFWWSKRICCFDEVFLMRLTSTEQLIIERPLYTRFLHNDHLPYFKELCKFLCNIGFIIFHLSEAATGSVLLEKMSLEISQNSQGSTCFKVSFLIKLQNEATAPDLSRVFSWRFLVYFISTEKWNEKRKIPRWISNIYFFARVSICLGHRFKKKFVR